MTEIFSQLFFTIGGVLSGLMSSNFGFVLILIGQGLLMAVFLLLSAYFLIYADRKVWAAVQLRRGPNVVGAFGLLQSGADMLKLVFKEIVVPAGSDKFEYKIKWLNALKTWLTRLAQEKNNLILLGDFNIAPDDEDVHDPELWRDKILCSAQERNLLESIKACLLYTSPSPRD